MKYVKRNDCKTIEELFCRNMQAENLSEVNEWFKRYQSDSYEIKDLDKAIEIIESLDKATPILIAGDYDVDGTTASAIMFLTLEWLGFGNVKIYIPDRVKEGFGINFSVFDHISQGLIITVDNGIAQPDVIREAKKRGYTVILSDHHEANVNEHGKPEIPEADVVIDPNALKDQADFSSYCGAGLAFKLARRLLKNDPEKRQILLSLCCLGTICDVVPLVEENYCFVRNGLKCLQRRNTSTSGIYALCQAFNLVDNITAEDVGFSIGPAINAVSRMLGNAMDAVNLLKYDGNYNEAKNLAQNLVSLNQERKADTNIAFEKLKTIIGDTKEAPIVAYIPYTREGLIGILAGKVVEEYKVPAIVLTDSDTAGVLKGSCRSCDGYDIKTHLDMTSNLLVKYGGHKDAAGLSIIKENLDIFKKTLINMRDFIQISNEPTFEYDFEISPAEIRNFLENCDRFEPYGEGNEAPIFKISNYKLKINKDGKYYRLCGNNLCSIRLENRFANAIGFGIVNDIPQGLILDDLLTPDAVINVYGKLSWNCFNGKKTPQIQIMSLEICEPDDIELIS